MAQSSKDLRFIISGNLTDDGAAAYMTADDRWVTDAKQAQVLTDDSQVQDRLKLAGTQERVVCDPYAVKVRAEGDAYEFITARETIRATGPTTRLRRPDPIKGS